MAAVTRVGILCVCVWVKDGELRENVEGKGEGEWTRVL